MWTVFPIQTPAPITPEAYISGAGTLVMERFTTAQAWGTVALGDAQALLDAIASQEFDVGWDISPWVPIDDAGLGGLSLEDPSHPAFSSIVVDPPPFSATAPEMPDVVISIEDPPPFDVTDPGFDIPLPPDVVFPDFSTGAPAISDPTIPTPPAVNLPPVPNIVAPSIPSPPTYDLPDFSGTLPVTDLTPPEPMFVWHEAEYNSAIRQQIATKLLSDLISGGSGLDADTEQAIYDRATARQELEHNQMYDEANNYFASRGWRLPPGVLAGRLLESAYRINQIREDLNNDILIQQSKLAQENTHFIIDRAIQNEKNLMDYTNVYQQRAFEAAKYVVESALIIFQIKVDAYKAQLEIYKVQAQVFEARIRAEVAKAELYKAQIEGIKVSVDAQRLYIDAYKAQVESILAYIEIYKSEMEGARIRAEVDKIKIQSYGVLVEAYKARVLAATEKYKGYQAQIAGEEAKARMYAAQVDGYKSKVEAYKVKADVVVSEVEAQVELNKGRVDSFRAMIEKYKAQVDASIEQAKVEVEIEKFDLSVYEADVRKYLGEVDVLTRVFVARVEEAKAKADVDVKEADIAVREAIAKYSLAESAAEAAAKVAAQIAASTLSMVSATASIGYDESRRDASSYSASNSYDGRMSLSGSESYHYHKTLD